MDPVQVKRMRARLGRLVDPSLTVLRQLVSENSFTSNRAGVNLNGRMMIDAFSPLDFGVRSVPSSNERHGEHLFLTRPGGGPEIVLISHLDTVYPRELEREHDFRWREQGDRIYGPGVADIKGGSVLISMILQALAAECRPLFESVTWHVMFNAAEEEGSADFRDLAREYINEKTAACLVYEHGTETENGTAITVSRRGSARFYLEVSGRAAHSGSGHSFGASAVRELARLIEQLEARTDYDRGVTYNVGLIEGGVSVNTVPNTARGALDLRTDRTEDYEREMAFIESLAGEGTVRAFDDGLTCTINVERGPSYPPWPANEASDRLAATFCETAEQIGLPLEPRRRLGASDGCHVWDLAPTVDGLGPIGANIHSAANDPQRGTRQESVQRSSFVDRALLSAAGLVRLIEQSKKPKNEQM